MSVLFPKFLTWNTARCSTSSKKSLKSFSWASRRGVLRKSCFSAAPALRSSVPLASAGVDGGSARGRSPDIFRRGPAVGPALPSSVRADISSLTGMTRCRARLVDLDPRRRGRFPLYVLTPTASVKDVSLQCLPALFPRGVSARVFLPALVRLADSHLPLGELQRIGSPGIPGRRAAVGWPQWRDPVAGAIRVESVDGDNRSWLIREISRVIRGQMAAASKVFALMKNIIMSPDAINGVN